MSALMNNHFDVAQKPFALFDFDNTIASGDSIVPYLLFCVKKGICSKAHAVRAAVKFLLASCGKGTIMEAKQFAFSCLEGKTQEELTAVAHEFWQKKLTKRFYPKAVAEMKRLREAGCHVLVVSASCTAYMDVLLDYLPADGVIATVTGMDGDGRCNGYMGENCAGLQKSLRIASYLAAKHLLLDYDQSYAFGDSASDEPMLRLTAHPTLVNPSAKVRQKVSDAAVVRWGRR